MKYLISSLLTIAFVVFAFYRYEKQESLVAMRSAFNIANAQASEIFEVSNEEEFNPREIENVVYKSIYLLNQVNLDKTPNEFRLEYQSVIENYRNLAKILNQMGKDKQNLKSGVLARAFNNLNQISLLTNEDQKMRISMNKMAVIYQKKQLEKSPIHIFHKIKEHLLQQK
jgi:hypothetical protein